tara:strand:- start:458174 stop:458605 length:432 start_codon:yes stop_codon:yes gene_type:complete
MHQLDQSNETCLVFVYGTLKRGLQNAAYLEKAQMLGRNQTAYAHYALLAINNVQGDIHGERYDYPGLVDNGKHHVLGEVYAIPTAALQGLDALEDVDHEYHRREINLNNNVKAWAYFYIECPSRKTSQEHKMLKTSQNSMSWG